MTIATSLQPDQQPTLWNDHVAVYETVFERLTNGFSGYALDRLNLPASSSLVDIAAGCGGAALMAASRGINVLAVDASQSMISRIRERAVRAALGSHLRAEIMDGQNLSLPDASFDGAISVFGVILFPDAQAGMREMARILKPGGRAAVVTWTEPQRYEVAIRLIDAIAAIRGPQPAPPTMPAQLRFREEAEFRALLMAGELEVEEIVRLERCLRAPSARWLAQRLEFAPGMATWLSSLGTDRERVLAAFTEALERDQGTSEIELRATAFIGTGRRTG